MRNFFRIGKIISLHGIKGEVKVYPTTDDIKRFDLLKEFYILDKDDAIDSDFFEANNTDDLENFNKLKNGINKYKLDGTKYIKNTCILKINGFDNIEDSISLVGKNIYVDRENAVGLNESEFYVLDLIGSKVFEDDTYIGEVRDIMKNKNGSILVVDYNKKDLLIPLVTDYIDNIDIGNSIIKIKMVEGLI